jgi:hypothetical protein
MLRLSCDAVDAPCGCEFSTTGPSGVVFANAAAMRPRDKQGHSGNNREQRSSGLRVPKVEVTRQYKLASRSASCVHGSLARARNRGDGAASVEELHHLRRE